MVNLCYVFFITIKKKKYQIIVNDLYSESSDCCSSPSDPWCFHTLQGWLCPIVSFASICLETIYSYFLAYQVVFPLVNNCLILKFCFNTHSFFFLLVYLYWYHKPNNKLYLVLCALQAWFAIKFGWGRLSKILLTENSYEVSYFGCFYSSIILYCHFDQIKTPPHQPLGMPCCRTPPNCPMGTPSTIPHPGLQNQCRLIELWLKASEHHRHLAQICRPKRIHKLEH